MPDETEQPAEVDADLDESPAGGSFGIVGIGASAGGLEATTRLLETLPADTGLAFVLVQHLSPSHHSALAEILSRATAMPVSEAVEGERVEPNRVYVIPPDRDMVIAAGILQLLPREDARGARHSIDLFFRALAADQRHFAIGVILSGTASDGTLGLEAIKAEGGITFAQDDSAQHEGMPRSAVKSGCVDFVLAPEMIAGELARIARHPYAIPAVAPALESEPLLDPVLMLLHRSTGVDFTQYKFNTLYRRVSRRMMLHKLEDIGEYAALVQSDPQELTALYRDILIGVTSFFRNPEGFDALKEQVFPRLLQNRGRHDPVRIWTLGCSTGQEAYSVAMSFAEFTQAQGIEVGLQVFATDLSAAAIDTARAGVYLKSIAQDVSAERLQRFFVEVHGTYRIVKSIRDSCVFSRHNLLADPPFSRLDLITCRNLLIYLEPEVQRKIVPTLHYALKPSGVLWLGTSEAIGTFRNLFDVLDAKHKFYAKRPGPNGVQVPLQPGVPTRGTLAPVGTRPPSVALELHRQAERLLLTRFAPPSVLVSADLEILQYHGDTAPYLTPAPGKASLALPKMLRQGLVIGVQAAIGRAANEGKPAREGGLRVNADGRWREVDVEVVPIRRTGGRDREGRDDGFLVLFHPSDGHEPAPVPFIEGSAAASPARPSSEDADVARLTQELTATREYLQGVIEQQEVASEELQSSNEEIQSANEELQSVNEELETSKEEIQSTNEELATVNDELNNRNMELSHLNSDLMNVLSSVQMPIVLTGPDLCVRRYTPAAERQFNLLPGDIGRPLAHIKLGLAGVPDLEAALRQVFDSGSNHELEVRDRRGIRYAMRLRPYRTFDDRIDGVVMVLVDVDLLKRAIEYAEAIIATVREPLLVLDGELRVQTASASFYRSFNVGRDETVGRLIYDLGDGEWNTPELRRLLAEVLPRDLEFNDHEVQHEFAHVGKRTMILNARRLLLLDDRAPAILLALEDVTERRRAEAAVRESEERFRTMADRAPVLIWITGPAGCEFVNQTFLNFIGASMEDVRGDAWTAYVHADDRPGFVERLQLAAEKQDVFEGEFRFRRADGEYRWMSAAGVPRLAPDGAFAGFVGSTFDITEQRARSNDLRQTAADLIEADRRKNEFLAVLAHELRNPLAPIRHGLQIVRLTEGNGEAAEAACAMMERQIAQMVRLVEDLLDISRITRGRIDLRLAQVELTAIVQDAVEAARPPCVNKSIELSVSVPGPPIYLLADATRLIQVVENLLSNACKFTDAGGRVELIVERDGGDAVIRVRDTGIGIPADQLARVFEMFTQVDMSLERSAGGLGIGLTLVKALVELHGGSVDAHSAGSGQGSEFVVRLPIEAPAVQSPSPQAKGGEPAAVGARRILVVDDNRDAGESLIALLRLGGHETRLALDGLDAIQAAADFHPEVVLMDIGLPKLNGYEAARRIREQPGGKDIVLVAVTGFSHEEDRQRSSQAGFDHHLVKPVNYDALKQVLAEPRAADKDG